MSKVLVFQRQKVKPQVEKIKQSIEKYVAQNHLW
jgi:hypothetical protein